MKTASDDHIGSHFDFLAGTGVTLTRIRHMKAGMAAPRAPRGTLPARLALGLVLLLAPAGTARPAHAEDGLTGPIVEPRRVVPDSVRALARARADGGGERAPGRHLPGGQALAVGLAATAVPSVLAVLFNPPGSESDFAWEASLFTGAAAGVLAGPAVGLWSGGRGDLARRGLAVRGIGYGAVLVGAFAVARSFDQQAGAGTMTLAVVGIAGAALSGVSCVHDLAITPSATRRGRQVTLGPEVDARGRVSLVARF